MVDMTEQLAIDARAALIDTLTAALSAGLAHPGNPDTKQQPAVLFMPGMNPKTMPPPLRDAVNQLNRLITEAILLVIEQTHTITPKGNPDAL